MQRPWGLVGILLVAGCAGGPTVSRRVDQVPTSQPADRPLIIEEDVASVMGKITASLQAVAEVTASVDSDINSKVEAKGVEIFNEYGTDVWANRIAIVAAFVLCLVVCVVHASLSSRKHGYWKCRADRLSEQASLEWEKKQGVRDKHERITK